MHLGTKTNPQQHHFQHTLWQVSHRSHFVASELSAEIQYHLLVLVLVSKITAKTKQKNLLELFQTAYGKTLSISYYFLSLVTLTFIQYMKMGLMVWLSLIS